MSSFTEPVAFDPAPGGAVSRREVVYEIGRLGSGHRIVIPAGTFTNFGDVPWPFRSLLPPRDPRFLAAFLLHDELCRQAALGDMSRRLADAVFYDAMKIVRAPAWRRKLMYFGVRFWALLKSLRLRA